MRKSRYTAALIVILLAAVFYGAYLLKAFTVSVPPTRNVTVVLKSLNVRSDYWQTVNGGAQAAAKQAGAAIELAGPLQETDGDAQIQAIEEAIQRKPQAMVIAPFNDERMPDLIRRIRQAGIRLVIIDTPLGVEPHPPFVGHDHVEAGRLAGRKAAELTGGRPRVAVMTDFSASAVSLQRKQGVLHELSEYPDSLYGTYSADDSEERAYDIAKSLLREEPDFNAFIALSQNTTLGVARALQDTGYEGTVKLVGFDGSVSEIQMLEDGALNAMIVQKPFNMGYLGVKTALDELAGKRVEDAYIESTLVTRDNLYEPEIQKLLFPFIQNP
ncbi:substrate-binding domain-containing protein [Cohnella caldifontis]|uniref:substrate-binding domain-containing protein n=1 Tax=Cohnella caldifontis TaxID=3027471 RepID=UPI0023ED3CFE|nr:substrate-binding domain-containing protein [Cohnella sp. YIM B05605]